MHCFQFYPWMFTTLQKMQYYLLSSPASYIQNIRHICEPFTLLSFTYRMFCLCILRRVGRRCKTEEGPPWSRWNFDLKETGKSNCNSPVSYSRYWKESHYKNANKKIITSEEKNFPWKFQNHSSSNIFFSNSSVFFLA